MVLLAAGHMTRPLFAGMLRRTFLGKPCSRDASERQCGGQEIGEVEQTIRLAGRDHALSVSERGNSNAAFPARSLAAAQWRARMLALGPIAHREAVAKRTSERNNPAQMQRLDKRRRRDRARL
jgi:N-acyl-D-aspartate/D-glutamate deacylase